MADQSLFFRSVDSSGRKPCAVTRTTVSQELGTGKVCVKTNAEQLSDCALAVRSWLEYVEAFCFIVQFG